MAAKRARSGGQPTTPVHLPTWSRLSKVVVNSSVTKVVLGRRGTSLVSFNDHGHLEGREGLLTYR